MATHTLKTLRFSHRKIFKYVWPFFIIMYQRVYIKAPPNDLAKRIP